MPGAYLSGHPGRPYQKIFALVDFCDAASHPEGYKHERNLLIPSRYFVRKKILIFTKLKLLFEDLSHLIETNPSVLGGTLITFDIKSKSFLTPILCQKLLLSKSCDGNNYGSFVWFCFYF